MSQDVPIYTTVVHIQKYNGPQLSDQPKITSHTEENDESMMQMDQEQDMLIDELTVMEEGERRLRELRNVLADQQNQSTNIIKIPQGHYRTLEELVSAINVAIADFDMNLAEQCQIVLGQDNRISVSLQGSRYMFKWPSKGDGKELGSMLVSTKIISITGLDHRELQDH